jgi:hypothetical protein
MELTPAPLRALSLEVVGVRHPNRDGSNRKFEILLCKPGDPVELRPEPKNKHDERAIAVFSERGVQLGYLTAERCGRIGQIMRDGHEVTAVFQGVSPRGAWIRAAFDGEVPEIQHEPMAAPLSTTTEEVDPTPEFYPDEEWPDD